MNLSPPLRQSTAHREISRFLRFATVGLLGTMIDFGLLVVLKEVFFLPTLLANSMSFSAGVANNFTLNRLWTYADSRSKRAALQMAQFATVSIVGVLLNNAIVLSLEGPFGALLAADDSGYLPAKVMATGVVVFWNFLANRYWTFGDVE